MQFMCGWVLPITMRISGSWLKREPYLVLIDNRKLKQKRAREPLWQVEDDSECYNTRIPPTSSNPGASKRIGRLVGQSGLFSMGRHLEAHRCCRSVGDHKE